MAKLGQCKIFPQDLPHIYCVNNYDICSLNLGGRTGGSLNENVISYQYPTLVITSKAVNLTRKFAQKYNKNIRLNNYGAYIFKPKKQIKLFFFEIFLKLTRGILTIVLNFGKNISHKIVGQNFKPKFRKKIYTGPKFCFFTNKLIIGQNYIVSPNVGFGPKNYLQSKFQFEKIVDFKSIFSD